MNDFLLPNRVAQVYLLLYLNFSEQETVLFPFCIHINNYTDF